MLQIFCSAYSSSNVDEILRNLIYTLGTSLHSFHMENDLQGEFYIFSMTVSVVDTLGIFYGFSLTDFNREIKICNKSANKFYSIIFCCGNVNFK